MSQSLRILLSVVLIWPVAYHGFSIAGKPVDLVASDFLPLALAIALGRAIPFRDLQALRLRTSFRLAAFWCAAFVVCCLAIAAFGFVASGEKIRVASALKFVKPISFFLVGQLLAPVLGTVNFLQILPRTCLGLIWPVGFPPFWPQGFPTGPGAKRLAVSNSTDIRTRR
jgi:hypothetical protein